MASLAPLILTGEWVDGAGLDATRATLKALKLCRS